MIVSNFKIFSILMLCLVSFMLTFSNLFWKNTEIFFLIFVSCERIWETYFIVPRKRVKAQGPDPILMIFSFLYPALLMILISETLRFNIVANKSLAILSFFLFSFAIFVRLKSINTLGQNWSINSRMFGDIKGSFIITSGPYQYVRHPIYLSFIVEVLFLPLMFCSLWGFLFSICIFVPLILFRLKQEEEILIKNIGKNYLDYMQTTAAFIPRLRNIRVVKK